MTGHDHLDRHDEHQANAHQAHSQHQHADHHGPHQHGPHQHGGPQHGLEQPDAEHMATLLDLDAAVTGHYLDEVSDRINTLAADPRTIADLGSGTGTGTLALARRFPTAQVMALDNATDLLDRVSTAARDAGFGDRVRTVVADLDAALPADLTDIDVVWASSTMHHFADPEALLRSTHRAQRAGGVLTVIEIEDLPMFLPPDSPEGVVEQRLHDTVEAQGWNSHPDWSSTIAAAGYEVVETLDIVTDLPAPPKAADYAATWLTRVRDALSEQMSPADRAVVDELLSDDHPSSLHTRDDLIVRARRIAWIARRP